MACMPTYTTREQILEERQQSHRPPRSQPSLSPTTWTAAALTCLLPRAHDPRNAPDTGGVGNVRHRRQHDDQNEGRQHQEDDLEPNSPEEQQQEHEKQQTAGRCFSMMCASTRRLRREKREIRKDSKSISTKCSGSATTGSISSSSSKSLGGDTRGSSSSFKTNSSSGSKDNLELDYAEGTADAEPGNCHAATCSSSSSHKPDMPADVHSHEHVSSSSRSSRVSSGGGYSSKGSSSGGGVVRSRSGCAVSEAQRQPSYGHSGSSSGSTNGTMSVDIYNATTTNANTTATTTTTTTTTTKTITTTTYTKRVSDYSGPKDMKPGISSRIGMGELHGNGKHTVTSSRVHVRLRKGRGRAARRRHWHV